MHYKYKPYGVCSSNIEFDINDGFLSNVKFTGGCDGNLSAISKLVEGKNAKEVCKILKGNTCGNKKTSCADQLSQAIDEALISFAENVEK